MIRGDLFSAVCFGIPICLLSAGYIWLAVDNGTVRLLDVVVHESGRYTLQSTIFYYSHFLREIPIDVAYALFLSTSCAAAWGIPSRIVPRTYKRAATMTGIATAAAVGLVVLALGAASAQQGLRSALYDLFQYRTRGELSVYGSHWHFHWLSTIWFGALTMLYVPLSEVLFGNRAGDAPPWPRVIRWLPWMYVAALTLLFGLSSDIFVNVRYTGHQAREILTHGPITVLLGLGTLHVASRLLRGSRSRSLRGQNRMPILTRERSEWIALALVFVIPAFLALVSFSGDVMDAGQSEHGLAPMVAGHAFEHVLDYAFVTILAVTFYGWTVLISAKHGGMR